MPSEAPAGRPSPVRRRILRIGIAAAVGAAVVTVAGIAWAGRPAAPAKAGNQQISVQSAALVTMDMSTTQTLAGTLGYGTDRTVKGGRTGVVTWLPAPGKSVKRGQQLYRVDDKPVPLFYGDIPLFRALDQRDLIGRDVRVVADNLRALGYDIGHQPRAGEQVAQAAAPAVSPAPSAPPVTHWLTVHRGDGVLTAALQAAVKRWQTDLRLPVTGAVAPGDVAVLTGAVRVDSLAAQPGDSADGPLMSVTPTAKVITVLADATQTGTIDQGDRVTVELPDNKNAAGRVTTVGTALKVPDGDQSGPDATPKLTVTITVDQPAAIAKLDSADVQVDFVAETHKGVLAAPVGALLALSEGGYAVQVEGGGLVAVEIGIFAKGLVEVKGDGLVAGTKVVTTS
jgi:peptidoglycan hydrolase-like protein with peptidoglycan-binding domain